MGKYIKESEARKLICELGKRLYNKDFVAANDGNISIKIDDNHIIATPTGVSKGFMTEEMLVKLDLDGNVKKGRLKPSSEIKMHLRVYKLNKETKAVFHAHPPIATSFAVAGIGLDSPILSEAIVFLGEVKVAKYATPGSDGVADSIDEYCKNSKAVLLANHGALTWGNEVMEAYYRMETLEHYAKVSMYTGNILKQANKLEKSEIDELIELRKKMGL